MINKFLFHCSYIVQILDGSFEIGLNQPSGWTHVVLNYIGPNTGEGIRIYHDGVRTGSIISKDARTFITSGDGWVLVGRYYNGGYNYAGVDVDELLFFNKTLSDEEIMGIMNMV